MRLAILCDCKIMTKAARNFNSSLINKIEIIFQTKQNVQISRADESWNRVLKRRGVAGLGDDVMSGKCIANIWRCVGVCVFIYQLAFVVHNVELA